LGCAGGFLPFSLGGRRNAIAASVGDGLIMKEYAERFYSSPAWQETRRAYRKSRRNLCEICFAKGYFKPCEIVHHKVELTPENINDPNITLNWDNLQCVCRECHAEIHMRRKRRYKVDKYGRVIATE